MKLISKFRARFQLVSDPSFSSHMKLVDPDSISLMINQCNEEDMEYSDEEILIAHYMDSTTFIDEYLDTASLDSTNFSQESSACSSNHFYCYCT